MRQPEVARLLSLLLAVLVAAPVVQAALTLGLSAAFVIEYVAGGTRRPLSAVTSTPRVEPLAVAGAAVDRWSAGGGVPLVLVHGYAPAGKDEPRVREAAALLARAGFDVAVPTIPGLTRGRLRPDDVRPVVATLAARPQPTVIVTVSVGSGPALLAAADPQVRDRVRAVLSLGGYASASELLRFFLTGEYAWDGIHGRVVHDPRVVRAFVEANADLLDRSAPPVAELLERLSPERAAEAIRARLILVHGVDDPTIPYTESLRLAAARPRNTKVVLVHLFEHVDPGRRKLSWAALRELGALILEVYGLARAA